MSVKTQKGNDAPLRTIISHFKNIKSKQPTLLGVEQMLFDIQQPNKTINQLREYVKEGNLKAYKEGKVNLPLYRLNGAFKGSTDNSLIEANGLMTIDLDKFPNFERLQEERKLLELIPFVYAVFLSPSGVGLKALIRIPKVKTAEEYKRRFLAFEKALNSPYFDNSNSNISRACFTSYDAKPYINLDAKIFEGIEEAEQLKPKKVIDYNFKFEGQHPFAEYKLLQLCKGIEEAIEGEKHQARLKYSAVAGGYSASGQMNEQTALDCLIKSALNNTNTPKQAEKDVISAFRYGLNSPLYFDELTPSNSQKQALNHIKTKKDVLALTVDKIGKDKEAIQFIIDTINNNIVTSIQAPPGAGKTTIVKQFINNEYSKEKHVIIAPTNAICEQIADDLNAVVLNGKVNELDKITILKSRVIVTTYNSLIKVSDIGSRYLWIDEYDNLSRASYQGRNQEGDVCQVAIQYSEIAKKSILFSATPEPMINYYLNSKHIKLSLPTEKLKFNAVSYSWGKGIQALLQHIEGLTKDKKHIIRIDSKETIKQVNEVLKEQGIKTQVVYSEEEIEETIEFKNLVINETISENVQILLTTCKINEGFNILNLDIQTVTVFYNETAWSNSKNVNKDIQFFKRPRLSKEYSCYLLAPKSEGTAETFKNNIDKMLFEEEARKKNLFDKKLKEAEEEIEEVRHLNYRTAPLYSTSERLEDKNIITINGVNMPCIPIIIELINKEYIKYLSVEEYAQYIAKKSEFLIYEAYHHITINKKKNQPNKEETKNERLNFYKLLCENENEFYHVFMNLRKRGLTEKIKRIQPFEVPADETKIDVFTDVIHEYKFIDAVKEYSKYLFLKEKKVEVNKIYELLIDNNTSSKWEALKKSVTFEFLRSCSKDEITARQEKALKRGYNIMSAFDEYKTTKRAITLLEIQTVINKITRKNYSKSEAKKEVETVFSLELNSERKTYTLKVAKINNLFIEKKNKIFANAS